MSTGKEKSVKEKEEFENSEASAEDVIEEQGNEIADSADELDELIEDQQEHIRKLEEEIQQLKNSQLRKAAEMDNMRKRIRREREQIFQTSREAALEEFLPINDDLLRTLAAMEEGGAEKSYLDGVKMVANKFERVLEKHGVERIDEKGVPFDVDLHDAMLRQKPEDDSVESGTVLQVIENGYKIGDKTIRHAKVIVSE